MFGKKLCLVEPSPAEPPWMERNGNYKINRTSQISLQRFKHDMAKRLRKIAYEFIFIGVDRLCQELVFIAGRDNKLVERGSRGNFAKRTNQTALGD